MALHPEPELGMGALWKEEVALCLQIQVQGQHCSACSPGSHVRGTRMRHPKKHAEPRASLSVGVDRAKGPVGLRATGGLAGGLVELC